MADAKSRRTDSRVLGNDVPILYTTGSFYEVGFDVGTIFSDRIKGFCSENHNHPALVQYIATPKGKQYYQSTLDVCQVNFPQYIKEVQGMADGSGLPFETLFMMCLGKELYNVLIPSMERETSNGCTDILVNRPECKLLAHNEDCNQLIDKYGYIVSARVLENGEEVESFTAFCYPGIVPGGSLSFNRHGMVFTSDGLYPSFVQEKAPSRYMMARSVIKAKNVQEAITLLKNTGFGVGYGFTFNIVDVKDPSTMWSIEVGPHAGESKLHVYTLPEESDPSKLCYYIHTNSMEHLKDVPEIPDLKSSTSRRERAHQMDAPRTKEGAMAILGDTTNQEYPIYRTVQPTDPSVTVFTAVVDVLENTLSFYKGNPATPGLMPAFQLQIKDD